MGDRQDDIILPTITTLEQAREALAAVAAQGEGLQDLASSHFGAFMQLDQAFHAGDVAVRPMATAPTVDAAAPTPATLITHPYTRFWAEVFDAQYELLVITLYQAFGTPRAETATTDDRRGNSPASPSGRCAPLSSKWRTSSPSCPYGPTAPARRGPVRPRPCAARV